MSRIFKKESLFFMLLAFLMDAGLLCSKGLSEELAPRSPYLHLAFEEAASSDPGIVTIQNLLLSASEDKLMIQAALVNRAYWNKKKVSGFLFVVAEIGTDKASRLVAFPSVELKEGTPLDHRKGISFSILWQRPVVVSLPLSLEETERASIHFYAFDRKGALIMDRAFRLVEEKERQPEQKHEEQEEEKENPNIKILPSLPGIAAGNSEPPSLRLLVTRTLREQLDRPLRKALVHSEGGAPRYPIPADRNTGYPRVESAHGRFTQAALAAGSEGKLPARYLEALGLMKQGQPDKALKKLLVLKDVTQKGPLEEFLLYAIGECIYRLKMETDPKAVVTAYKNALQAYPASKKAPLAHLRIAMAFRKRGLLAESSLILEDLIKGFPGHPRAADAMFIQAENLAERGLIEDSIRLIEEAVKKYPNHPMAMQAMLYLAYGLEEKGRHKKAAEVLQRAVDQGMEVSRWPGQIAHTLSRILYKGGRFEIFRSTGFKLLNIFPEDERNATLLEEIGRSYALQGRWKEAMKVHLQAAASSAGTEHQRRHLIALARIWELHPDTSIPVRVMQDQGWGWSPEALYAQFADRFPSDPMAPAALFRKGLIQKSDRRYKEALSSFNSILENYEESPYALKAGRALEDTISEAIEGYFGKGAYEKVISFHLRRLNDRLISRAKARSVYLIAESYRRLGLVERAIPLYRMAIQKGASGVKRSRFLLALASSYAAEGRWTEALPVLEELAREDREDATARKVLELLAEASVRSGRFKEAKRILRSRSRLLTPRASHWFARGMEGEEPSAAEALYRRILQLKQLGDPMLKRASRERLADLLFGSRRYEEAYKEYKRMVDKSLDPPLLGRILYRMAICRMELGDREGADRIVARLKEVSPERIWISAAKRMLELVDSAG